jgi:hypothetical protein
MPYCVTRNLEGTNEGKLKYIRPCCKGFGTKKNQPSTPSKAIGALKLDACRTSCFCQTWREPGELLGVEGQPVNVATNWTDSAPLQDAVLCSTTVVHGLVFTVLLSAKFSNRTCNKQPAWWRNKVVLQLSIISVFIMQIVLWTLIHSNNVLQKLFCEFLYRPLSSISTEHSTTNLITQNKSS